MKALRRARHRWLRLRRDESGFGLMELVVASTVMMSALTSMAYVTTSAFGDIAMAKERQTANALLDEAIEQLRALPYDTVSLGMRTSDLAGDPRVIGSGTAAAPYRLATTNDRIVHVSTNQVIAPLVPNVSSRTIDNKVYAVRVYLTHFQDDPATGAVTATAYADWTSSARNAGQPVFLRASTLIFSPAAASAGSSGACLSTATHAFSGPCLAFFYGSASADAGQISLSGEGILNDVLGTTLLGLPGASSSLQVEQTSSVLGRALGAGAAIKTARQGFEPTVAKADNDPASAGSVTYENRSGSNLSVSLSASSGPTSLSISGSGNAANAVSTTAASDAQACRNAADTANLTDRLPCGRVSAHLGSMDTKLKIGTLDLTANLLGDLSPVTMSDIRGIAHTDRNDTSAGGTCDGAGGTKCTAVSTATRTIDSLQIGRMPDGEALLKLEGFRSTVTAEAGINAALSTSTATGTVKVWRPNLLGIVEYETVDVVFGSGVEIETATATIDNLLSTGVRLIVSAELRTGVASSSSTAATCLESQPCVTRAEATMGSPVVGVVTYRFEYGSRAIGMTVMVDLGSVTASASYADPPTTA